MWGGAGAGRGREVLGVACGRGGGALSTQPNRCRCVHWPSGLTDSSLMEASVCRSGAVWGLWGAGLGASGSVGQRWWSIESIRAFPIGWVDVSILTPVRVRGGDGGGREVRLGGICLWRVCLCGACSGHLSAVSRRPCGQRVFFSSDIMASTRAPPPVAPRRAADGGGGLHLGLLDVLVFMHSRHARPPV